MIPAVLSAGCFSESSSDGGPETGGPGTAGSETSTATSTHSGADTTADASTTSPTTTDEPTSAGPTTEGDATSTSADSSGDPPFEPCPALVETFDVCPGAPWVASGAGTVDCDGDAVLTVTSAIDGNVTLMVPVGLADATAVVEMGDAPEPGMLKVLRVRNADAQVIAYRTNGTTAALEAYVDSGNSKGLLASAPYDPDAHRWVRLREDAGWLYFETSADGVTFAPFYDEMTPFDVADTTVGVAAGNVAQLGEDTRVSFGQFEFYCTPSPAGGQLPVGVTWP